MNELYPLKFSPLFKEKIWGGQRAHTHFGFVFSPLPNCGEVWALSGIPGQESVVSNGFLKGNDLKELIGVYMEEIVGEKAFESFGDEFPLLIKFLDSNDWLSIQVHPDDELAANRHNGTGKTEMWYVMDAEPGAELISGFRSQVTREEYLDKLKSGNLASLMNYEKVERGDVFYVPAGRVHALGPGLFIAEIQQSSDHTYRIFDFNRVDKEGNLRELHTELALDALDFNFHSDIKTTYPVAKDQTVTLVKSPYFQTGILHFGTAIDKDYTDLDSFIILLGIEGRCTVRYIGGSESLKAGEVILVPAFLKEIQLDPDPECKLLEVFIP